MAQEMTQEEARGWAALASARGMTAEAGIRLMKAIGLPEEVLRADLATLSRLVGMPLAQAVRAAGAGANDDEVDQALEWLAREPGAKLLPLASPEYPPLLIESGFAPLVLWLRGDNSLLKRRIIAAAGAERPSDEARQNAIEFGEALARQGAAVAAPLFGGTEVAALEGALRAGQACGGSGGAIAVLATGPDRVYPASARALQRRICLDGGLLLSACPPGAGIPAEREARAARLDEAGALSAALASGLLVVSAERRSPALKRARWAADFGRDVWAVPGSIHSPESAGPHQLIREGARLAESAADILG